MKMVWLLLLLLHLIISGVFGVLLFTRRLPLPRIALVPVLLMPPAGAAAVLAAWVHTTRKTEKQGREIGVEKLKTNNELYQNVFYATDDNANLTVPLREALILNDTKTKRALMMDVLGDDPEQYIGLLQTAQNDADTEVSHYAATAMTELQKSYDFRLQKCERAYAAAPENRAVLQEYLACLKTYLDTNLLDGSLLAMYRRTYLQLLEQYAGQFDASVRVLRALFEVQLALGDYSAAERSVQRAVRAWPQEAASWLMQLELNAAMKNSAAMRETLRQLKSKRVYIPEKDRATVEFWNHEKA